MNTSNIANLFNLTANQYDLNRKGFIPCFDDFYEVGVKVLKDLGYTFNYILDLGAGTGLLTKYLYSAFSTAEYELIDLSKEMLGIAKSRFSEHKNVKFIEDDYYINFPTRKYDLIGSALSIHHFDESEKKELYQKIYNGLNGKGIFINIDQFVSDVSVLEKSYNTIWMKYITRSVNQDEINKWLERRKIDKENSIEKSINLLRDIGFRYVDCVYRYMKFGIIIAIKK